MDCDGDTHPAVDGTRASRPVWATWFYLAASIASVATIVHWTWSWFLFGWSVLCLLTNAAIPRAEWTAGRQRICTGVTLGLLVFWAGLRFVGWRERMAPPYDGCFRDLVGLPIPGVRRYVYEYEPGTIAPNYNRFMGPIIDPGTQDLYAFIANATVLVALGIWAARYLPSAWLRRTQVTAGWLAAVVSCVAMAYICESENHGDMFW